MTHPDGLAGALVLHPGGALPAIRGGRPELAARMAVGRPAQSLPALLASLFTLCASVHRAVSRRAVAAALGEPDPFDTGDAQAHRASQAREQVLRIGFDWPRQWSQAAHTAQAEAALQLRSCPLLRSELDAPSALAALPAWLQHKWLGITPHEWLAAHEAAPADWAARWCESAPGAVAAGLHTRRAAAAALQTHGESLNLLAHPDQTMPELARRMAGAPGFCQQPSWQGGVPDTGPWSRHRDPLREGSRGAASAWSRLVSRLVDLLRLAAPGGEHWLAHGVLRLGPGEGIAWAEMARGLLVHHVRLDGHGDAARVAACHVLAPTEWNFHPQGVLAQALAGLRGPAMADDARLLAVAFDPCMDFVVHAPAARTETRDA